MDKLVRFSPLEFIPLHCETTNQLMAGVRFWRIDPKKPLHIQLYTMDGLQEFVQIDNAPLTPQGGLQPYRRNVYAGAATYSEAITSYNRLPIIPLHVNSDKISELTPPIEGKINAYDLLQTSKLDDFVTTKPIYWRIEGFSGEIGELLKIKEALNLLGIIATNEPTESGRAGIGAEITNLNYAQTKEFLQDLEFSIFRDAQVVNTEAIVTGNITATAVKFSSLAEDNKVKSMERYAAKFIAGILELEGLPANDIQFTHKNILNDEEVTRILQMHHAMGVPIELLLEESPLAQGKVEDWIKFIQSQTLGMDNYGQVD